MAAAILQYLPHTKRTIAEVLNTKAFYIERGAARLTKKVPREEIERELGVTGYTVKQITRGKNAGKFRRTGYLTQPRSLAETLVRARLFRKKEPQPDRAGVTPLIKKLINYRVKTRAFLAAGWLPGIRHLARFAKDKSGAPRADRDAKSWSPRVLGGATEANPWLMAGLNAKVVMWNDSVAKHPGGSPEALEKHAGAALRQAIADEIKNMADYLAKKMQQATNPHNAK